MFVLHNAWLATKRHPWRAGLTAAAALVVSFGTLVSMAIVEENTTAHGATYDSQPATVAAGPNAATRKTYDGADSSYTEHYLTWDDYNNHVSLAQEKGANFVQTDSGGLEYTMSEDLPVRQTEKFQAIAGSADQSADKTGGEFQLRSFNNVDAAKSNDWGRYKVVDGKHLTYSHGDKGVLISREVADKNELKVGDKVSVGLPTDASKTIELTVRGIYEYVDEPQGTDAKLAKDNRLNAIYCAYYLFVKNDLDPGQTEAKAEGWAVPDLDIRPTLTSPADFDTYVKAVKKSLPKGLELTSPSLEEYERSIQPLSDAAARANVTRYALLGVGGIALLALTFGCAWAGRKPEIANSLLIGASKGRLAGQLMVESLALTVPGLAIGIVAGAFAAKPLGAALAGGHATPINAGLVWPAVGWAAATAVVLAIVAAMAAATFNTKQLFTANEVDA